MPNIKSVFARRRSGSTVLDEVSDPHHYPPSHRTAADSPAAPGQPSSSFRVLERHDKLPPPPPPHSSDGRPPSRVKPARAFHSPLLTTRGKSAEELAPAGANRGSGATTNSGSSGYYGSSNDSARHSSSSTLPSSVDHDHEPADEELFPIKTATAPLPMRNAASPGADEAIPPPPSFTARAARALSFGQRHNRSSPVSAAKATPPPPALPTAASHGASNSTGRSSRSPQRDRSTTTSSYASTAVPGKPEPNLTLGFAGFGDDLGSIFDGIGKNHSRHGSHELPLPPPPTAGTFHRTESEPMFPPKTLSRQALTPSPGAFKSTTDEPPDSPYAWDRRASPDGVLSGSALSSPRLDDAPPPELGQAAGIAPAFLGRSNAGYSLVSGRGPSPGQGRMSFDSQSSADEPIKAKKEPEFRNRQTHLDDGDRWVRRVELRDGPTLSDSASHQSFQSAFSSQRKPTGQTASAPRSGAISPESDEGETLFDPQSKDTTPRATGLTLQGAREKAMPDSSPLGPPSRAIRPGAPRQDLESEPPKKMTKAQFDALKRRASGHLADGEEEKEELDDEYDEEDDAERAKQLSRQRAKNEANLAVYRQQMKKVTGGGPSDLPPSSASRPSLERHSLSAPAAPTLHMGGIGGTPPTESVRGKPSDEDDDDVPLGILQAHGFPSISRPPTVMGENDAQRRSSLAGSVSGGGGAGGGQGGQGALPPFARKLPADPYFGAGLVHPAQRESLAFSGTQSVYGGPPAPPQSQPGGLVGVIAGEERAKAARRGSPNPATGTYNPLPSNMPPAAPRAMSMAGPSPAYGPNGAMMGMPPMPGMSPQMPMMMMPQQDPAQQQMQQFMQMQMQVMQNMLAMQQQQMGQGSPQPAPSQSPDYLGVPQGGLRPMSMGNPAPSFPGQAPNQGRAMTMMNPPAAWNVNEGPQRPTSYAPSVIGVGGGGPGPGYTPSIAPSERSNVGLPTRYRPVSTAGDAPNGRSQSLTSGMTLRAFAEQQQAPRPSSRLGEPKSTIRVVDKPKGTPKVTSRHVDADEDDEEGWAEMAKKRSEKKFGRRKKHPKGDQDAAALSELYHNLD